MVTRAINAMPTEADYRKAIDRYAGLSGFYGCIAFAAVFIACDAQVPACEETGRDVIWSFGLALVAGLLVFALSAFILSWRYVRAQG